MHFNVALEKQQPYGVVPNHYPKQKQLALQLLLGCIELIHPHSSRLGGVIHHSPLDLPGPKQKPAFFRWSKWPAKLRFVSSIFDTFFQEMTLFL